MAAETAHETFIHPLAFVENSSLGAGTKVWQFASVIRGTKTGAECVIASGATLDGPWLGNRCLIGSGCAIGPGFLVGDDVFIGPNVTFCNDRWPNTSKDGFDADALRTDFVTIHVKNGAAIGANAVILPGVTIGERAMIAAGAVVNINIPANTLFTRDGKLVLIDDKWRTKRMREAK